MLKDNDSITLKVFDNKTDKTCAELHDIESVNLETRKNYEQLQKLLSSNYTLTLTFNSKTDNSDELKKIINNLPEAYNIQFLKIIQARKHHKKRINKKWLKHYGYKKVIVDSKGWKIKTYANGIVKFIK